MQKLDLNTPLLFGQYKGKTVRQYADEKWFGFKKWYDSKPYIFSKDVENYVQEINTAIKRNRF